MGGGILILTRNNNYMWKGTAVIGGNVGGIRHQIEDGEVLRQGSRPTGLARRDGDA